MRSPSEFDAIYLHRDPIDFRKWIDGLVAIVEAAMQLDPFGRFLFVFTNKSRDKIKALYWDRTGYALWMKRLEKHVFKWPRRAEVNVVALTAQQMSWLLDGYDLAKMTPHETLTFETNS